MACFILSAPTKLFLDEGLPLALVSFDLSFLLVKAQARSFLRIKGRCLQAESLPELKTFRNSGVVWAISRHFVQ